MLPVRTGTNSITAYFWVAAGGALGSVLRFWLSGLVAARFGDSFPWGTVIINITGSFLIGVIGAVAAPEGRLESSARAFATLFLMIGTCGGYTTFSSFSLQTLNLLRDGQWLYASGNVLVSVFACLLAVWLGWWLGSTLHSQP